MARERKRRQYGTGSVYRRASDGRWIGKIQAGWNSNGTRRVITVSARTEADAKVKLKKKQIQIAESGIPAAGTARTTVKAWSQEWLPMHAKTVRPKSYGTDASHIHKWVIPTIGHRRLEALAPADIRAVHNAITRPDPPDYPAGRSTSTALRAHRALFKMLKAAILEGHAVPPRVLLVQAPTKAVSDRDAIPLPHALALLEAAAHGPDVARWATALLQAMRPAETLGLTRDAIDLNAHVLDISWQLQTLTYLDRKNKALGFRIPDGYDARHLTGAYHLTRPKTEQGKRIIPLVPWMTAALTDRLATAPDNPWGLLWTALDERNGQHRITPARAKDDRAAWKALQDQAGVRHVSGRYYTLYEARHTTATLLLEASVDPETVKAIMGHSSIAVSRGYQHVSQELTRRALEGIAGRLGLGS